MKKQIKNGSVVANFCNDCFQPQFQVFLSTEQHGLQYTKPVATVILRGHIEVLMHDNIYCKDDFEHISRTISMCMHELYNHDTR